MNFFLRYVNPVLALMVLVVCLIAAGTAEGQKDGMVWTGLFHAPIPTYFLAKGIFCSAALLLLGKLLEQTMTSAQHHRPQEGPRRPLQFSLRAILGVITACAAVFGLVLWLGPDLAQSILLVAGFALVIVATWLRRQWPAICGGLVLLAGCAAMMYLALSRVHTP